MSRLPFMLALLAGLPAAAQFLHTDTALRATQGAEPGGFSAGNNDGAARYQYGFRLPTARGRYQPRLALSYASNGRNGPFGAGWSLNMSYIEASNRASPDSLGNPRKQLWLVLDGARRLLVAYPANQSTTYRPDVDNGYTLVTSTTDTLGRPAWSMVDGLGNQYVFQWLNGGSTATYGRWYLRSVTDVDSNTTLFEYNPEAGAAGASGLLSAIRYNNYGTYNNFANVVELSYGTNPNPQVETIGSSLIMHTQLLNAVNIKRQNANTGTLGLIYKYGIT